MIQSVTAHELTDTDLQWLVKVCNESYDQLDPEVMVRGLCAGDVLVFRLLSPIEGILMITETLRTGKKEWFINGFAGRGITAKIFAIVRELREIAKTHDVAVITGLPHREGLYKVYETLGAKPRAVLYGLEV